MFAGGFDFSLPAVDRFYRGDLDVDAGGEVFLEEGAGYFAGFGEGGAGYEDETECGGHGERGDCSGFGVCRREKETKITQSSPRTQRTLRREEIKRQRFCGV